MQRDLIYISISGEMMMPLFDGEMMMPLFETIKKSERKLYDFVMKIPIVNKLFKRILGNI